MMMREVEEGCNGGIHLGRCEQRRLCGLHTVYTNHEINCTINA